MRALIGGGVGEAKGIADPTKGRERLAIYAALVRELLRGEYLDKRENVLLIGNSGTGKTHLATALTFT
ncbi:MAG: ATP-binding protein, partial [Armatimonadetes bacterium]|nr:ATP-binding protein [Armatimonadota bacterium]